MTYEEILEKLKNDEVVDIKGIWSFYGKSYHCISWCCDDTLETVEAAAELAVDFAK